MHPAENIDVVSARVWEALGSCTDFVAVLTRSALAKPWVEHEWNVASAQWIATGQPRIYLAVSEDVHAIPEIPFTKIFKLVELNDDAENLFALEATESRVTNSIALNSVVQNLRSKYLMGGPTAVQAVHTFDDIFPTLQARLNTAAEASFTVDFSQELSWLRQLSLFFDLRSDQRWLQSVLSSAVHADHVDREAKNILLNNLGITYIYTGDWRAAEGAFSQASASCFDSKDYIGVAIAEANLALVALERGDMAAVPHYLERARSALGENRDWTVLDRNGFVETVGTFANISSHEGRRLARQHDKKSAFVCFSEQLALGEILENRRMIGASLGRMGWLDVRTNSVRIRTRPALQRYLRTSLATFNLNGVALANVWLGQLAILEGRFDVALSHFKEELLLRRKRKIVLDMLRALSWCSLASRCAGISNQYASELTEFALSVELGGLSNDDRNLLRTAGQPDSEFLTKVRITDHERPRWVHPAFNRVCAQLAVQGSPHL